MMNRVDLSTYNNTCYNPGACILKRFLWYYFNLFFIKNCWNPFSSIRVLILRLFGAKIGRKVIIKPGVNIKYPWYLSVKDNVWIGENVWIDNLTKVSIDSNVCISQGAMLLCGGHNYKSASFDILLGEISLEEGVWIGAQSVVCPGVTCKSHSVLCVGSVATKGLESYNIYQGNPAIKIHNRVIL